MSYKEVQCGKCREECVIEGECPKFYAWCDTCEDYAEADLHEYTIDYISSQVDQVYDSVRDHGWPGDEGGNH